MYLIDSIIKEFPEEYVPIFSNNLVKLFVETFKGSVSRSPVTKIVIIIVALDKASHAQKCMICATHGMISSPPRSCSSWT